MLNNSSIITLADNHPVPLVDLWIHIQGSSGSLADDYGRVFRQGSGEGAFMADQNKPGQLLLFPAPTPVPGLPGEDWDRRILETRDNLVSALEFLRSAYNERLAGQPVKAFDQIRAQVDSILRHDEKIPPYTVVGAIKVRGSTLPEAKRKILLFPAG
jgi:hypothetical protein